MLYILRLQAAMFGKPSKHPWANFLFIVESKHHIRPAWTGKRFM